MLRVDEIFSLWKYCVYVDDLISLEKLKTALENKFLQV